MKTLIVAALVVTSTPVVAAAAAGGEDKAEQAKERRICRRVNTSASQTRIGRGRLCLTAAQWRARTGEISVDDEMSSLDPISRTQGRPDLPN